MPYKKLSVLIIGCGNIAGLFDRERIGGEFSYTHASAYFHDERFDISACVEPDDMRRIEFMALWSIPNGFRTVDEVFNNGHRYDVISVCSPTASHANDIEIAIQMKPRLIFCEKPVTTSVAKTEKLVEKCRINNILLSVNYSRRFDPFISKLSIEIMNGKWGQLRSVMGCYSKGILNNGSHLLDLLNLLIGPMEIVRVGGPIHDFYDDDPTISVWLEGATGLPVYIMCGHAEDYSIFELQLVFSKGVLSMEEGGMYWRERNIKDSATFDGYRTLDSGVLRDGGYPYAMTLAIENIYHAVDQGERLASSGESALITQRLCEQIARQSDINV
jgi:predicted dehydrogenase